MIKEFIKKYLGIEQLNKAVADKYCKLEFLVSQKETEIKDSFNDSLVDCKYCGCVVRLDNAFKLDSIVTNKLTQDKPNPFNMYAFFDFSITSKEVVKKQYSCKRCNEQNLKKKGLVDKRKKQK